MSVNFHDVPIFGMLRTKLSWLTDRQQVLGQNISHASTPGFQAKDLKALSFRELMDGQGGQAAGGSYVDSKRVQVSREQVRFRIDNIDNTESSPNGNNVNLEDQLMLTGQTQADYRAAVDIYKKGLGLLRMAVSSPR